MNKNIQKNIGRVIKAWKEAERDYSFETRGMYCPIQIPSGEFGLKFYIVIDGFFEDSNYQKPIRLVYQSDVYLTTTLTTPEDSVRDDIDSNSLCLFLESFTEEAYNKTKETLASYKKSYTSDIKYMDI